MMYFYINFNDAKAKLYVNTQYDFMIQLPQTFPLEGEWECSLVQTSLKSDLESELYLYGDFVDNTMVHGVYSPLIGTFQKSERYITPFYRCVTINRINRIRFYIQNRKNETPDTINLTDFTFVLHFKKI